MRLSIIIPIYNTAKYLRKCIDSCLNQDISSSEYEIILINDGSPDESGDICLEYKDKYNNIVYLRQENSGQGVARNNALKIAQGNYIWFIDSDDFIAENSIDSLLKLCTENELDILRIGFKKVDESYQYNSGKTDEIIIKKAVSGKEFLKSKFVFGPPLYLFRREYLIKNDLSFYPNIYLEDNEFTPRALYYAKNIGETDFVAYYYLTRQGSTTLSVNPKKVFDLLKVCLSLINFNKIVDDEVKPYINNVISTSFNSLLHQALLIDETNQNKIKNLIYQNREIFRHMLKAKSVKFKTEGLLFTLCPKHVIQIYKLLK